MGAIDVHDVDIQVAILERREHNAFAVRRDHALGGVDTKSRQPPQPRSVRTSSVKIKRVEPPHITLGRIWSWRAIALQSFAGSEHDPAIAIHEVAAGSLAAAA